MEVIFCVATNAFANMVPDTKPPKFEGQAGFFYEEIVDAMDRYGNLTYIETKSYAACTDAVRQGWADVALVWENYPMPEEDNITQTNMLRTQSAIILSGFNQTEPFKPLPDLMVFDGLIISLFVLTSIAITLLYAGKLRVERPRRSFLKGQLTNYFINILSESCEVIFLTQPMKDHLLRYVLGTTLLTWTSMSLLIFYCSYLNTKQLVFNPPHLIKSYKQIEEEGIKPLITTEMNTFSLIENSDVTDAEHRIKKLVHKYGIDECRIKIQRDPDAMSKVALRLQQQKEVIIINEEVAQITKMMSCAVTHNIQSNLTFFSHIDEDAAKNYVQIVYSARFMRTTSGKRMRQFINSLFISSQIGIKALQMMERLADIFYTGSSTEFIARHKKTCASNYFEIPEPSIDPVENVIENVIFYLIGLASLALFFECFFKRTGGRFLNGHNRLDQFMMKKPRRIRRRNVQRIHIQPTKSRFSVHPL